tara:strand:+ start:9781 stop:11829 length:2049 start_codon:yes stop_codon:yes gene_type:complete
MAKIVEGFSFPDDATGEEITAFLQKNRKKSADPLADMPQKKEMSWGDYAKGVGRSAASGLTFNWSDELLAGARAKSEGIPYEQALKEEREAKKEFEGQYPVAAIASELAGSVPTMFVPGLGIAKGAQVASRVARPVLSPALVQGVKTGAVQGGLSGLGESDSTQLFSAEDIGSRLKSAAQGAGVGAVVGGGLSKGAEVLTPAVTGVLERFSPKISENVGMSRVLQDLERSGMTPEQAGKEWERMYKAGAPAQLFDVSPSLTNRAEVIAQRPGQAGIDIAKDVEGRQAGQRGRVMQATRETMGVKGDYYGTEEALTKALRSNAEPFYEAAYQAKIPTQAQALLQTEMDRVKEAFPEAIASAKKLYASDGDGKLGKFGTKEVSTVPGQSMKAFEEVPEVKQWDYIMRGLYQASKSAGDGTPLAGNALAMRRRIGDILDQNVDAFKSARAVYKGDKEILEALENGKAFNKADPELLAREWKDMGAGERQAYRVGALKNMRDNIFGSADTSDVTKRVGQNIEDRREALRIIMPNAPSARLLEESLEAEARLFKNANRIVGGPATARRIAGGKDLDASDFHMLGIAADVAQGKPSAIFKTMANILSGDVLIPEARANAIGKILRSGTPAEIRSAVNALENFATENVKRQASTARKTVRGAGLVAEEAGEYAGTPDYKLPPLTINRGP